MCDTCGCGEQGSFSIRKPGESEKQNTDTHSHDHGHSHDHPHTHEFSSGHHHHSHSGDHEHPHEQPEKKRRVVDVGKNILDENNLMAERNRGYFEAKGILCLNLVSSPGSGKTTILEHTVSVLKSKFPVAVIEGDQQSILDAERISKSGVPAVQINTGQGCHLDAVMINHAVKSMELEENSILFIENVGNLVCPALFDLGETSRILIMSVTEGDDKPLKYPTMFHSSDFCLINKSDLLPYVDFNVDRAKKNALSINPSLKFLSVSAKNGEGMEFWIQWLIESLKAKKS